MSNMESGGMATGQPEPGDFIFYFLIFVGVFFSSALTFFFAESDTNQHGGCPVFPVKPGWLKLCLDGGGDTTDT